MKQRTITFILPFVNLTGGIKLIFEHVNRLAERGHKVRIIYPGKLFHDQNFAITTSDWRWHLLEAPLRQFKYWLFVQLLHKTDANWFPLDRRIELRRTPDLSARYIPPSDLIVSVAPQTVHWVASYPPAKGQKVQFALDYEVWALPTPFVDSTFQYKDIPIITIGDWQKRLFKEKFGRVVDAVIPAGVDTRRFRPASKPRTLKAGQPVRVLMVYHHHSYKGIADGLAAIELVKEAGYPIETVMFGAHPLKSDVPADVEYRRDIDEEALPDIYRSCDIFLWPTHREGFGLPPVEAMACGLPVVGTDSGAMTDYMVEGKTGFIVPIQQPKQLADRLKRLVADQSLRHQMGKEGAKQMKAWDWEIQTDKLEAYLIGLTEKAKQ